MNIFMDRCGEEWKELEDYNFTQFHWSVQHVATFVELFNQQTPKAMVPFQHQRDV